MLEDTLSILEKGTYAFIETQKRLSLEGNIIKEGKTVTDPKTEQKATEWTDDIPDPEDERPEPYEETYRDGSTKNECWSEE